MQKEFSYPVKIDELNQNTYKFVLKADVDELKDITSVLQVVNVNFFEAEIFLKYTQREHLLRVWGNVKAQLVLKSVISLEDFNQNFDVPFEINYDTKATYKDIREMDLGINDNVPDIVENGVINLADVVMEQIALNIDDYPRAEGENFDFSKYSTVSEEKKDNPFAVLAKLKK